MKKFLPLVFLLAFLSSKGQGTLRHKIASNTIYIEGLGAGMRFSMNYDKAFRLPVRNLYISGSVGIAASWWNEKYLYFPIRVNVFYGSKNSFAELGMCMMTGYFWSQSFIHPEDYHRGTQTYWLPFISYRYQKLLNGGLYGQISLYPILNDHPDSYSYLATLPFKNLHLYDKNFVPWVGLSAGYTFRPRQK